MNPTYTEMAEHYGMGVLPARKAKPRDKAKVENAVLHAERWILARLRNRTFFSLKELNEAIAGLLEELNNRPMKQVEASRRELYESLDRPALRPLPANRYEFAEWKKVRVGPDYHVELEGHYYSVPYQLLRQQLDLRASRNTVEVFGKSKRVAAHQRDRRRGKHTTLVEHMPKAHQAHVEWTPVRLVKWARTSGEATAALVEGILSSRAHPQQGFRACLGVMRLGKKYGQDRLEAACRRAVAIQSYSYRSVHSILKRGLDQQPLTGEQSSAPVEHDNVRGAGYYASVEADEVTPC